MGHTHDGAEPYPDRRRLAAIHDDLLRHGYHPTTARGQEPRLLPGDWEHLLLQVAIAAQLTGGGDCTCATNGKACRRHGPRPSREADPR